MGFYAWRLRIAVTAARENRGSFREPADNENLIMRWREAMARERESRVAWSIVPELIPVRVPANRPRA